MRGTGKERLFIHSLLRTHCQSIKVDHPALCILSERLREKTGIAIQWEEYASDSTLLIIKAQQREAVSNYVVSKFPDLAFEQPEGYCISVTNEGVLLLAPDDRGILYGVGKLLRLGQYEQSEVSLQIGTISSHPHKKIRGHQLGYRPKTNAYDAWTKEQFETYIQDLALFGANSIEILPPRTDDDARGPLMKYDSLEMMIFLSQTIAKYFLDVWVWYPNMGEDYQNSEIRKAELEERRVVFSSLPSIDHLFIPGGDPGDLDVDELFAWTDEIAHILHTFHPQAKIWLSPQSFREQEQWIARFLTIINKERPSWLGGVVFAPWVRMPIKELRERLCQDVPIRRYPDICHSYACQYPDVTWDLPYALTLGREFINPRPIREKKIHNLFDSYADGSITYSEGIYDDVNKFIWSDQDWDIHTDPRDTLEEYATLFLSSSHAPSIAEGILALERNLIGPMATNSSIEQTLTHWKLLKENVPEEVASNYRFLLCLLRAYYDAYIRIRLHKETSTFSSVIACLNNQKKSIKERITTSIKLLEKKELPQFGSPYRQACFLFADALYETIGAQLTTTKHKAIAWNRGAFLDAIDIPLTNSIWLLDKLKRMMNLGFSEEQEHALRSLLERRCPRIGTFYVNFGDQGSEQYVVQQPLWREEDPGVLHTPFFAYIPPLLYEKGKDGVKGITKEQYERFGPVPYEWLVTLTALYDTPVLVRIPNLSKKTSYTLRITYIGVYYITNWGETRIKLTANGSYLIHDYVDVTGTCITQDYPIPHACTESGTLTLQWETDKGEQGPNIAELWLIPS